MIREGLLDFHLRGIFLQQSKEFLTRIELLDWINIYQKWAVELKDGINLEYFNYPLSISSIYYRYKGNSLNHNSMNAITAT